MWKTLAASIALILIPIAAFAGQCAPREQVIEKLNGKYGETRYSIGLAPNNSVIEVFASEQSGTWTITVTSARGMTCLMASGQAFEKLAEDLPEPGSNI